MFTLHQLLTLMSAKVATNVRSVVWSLLILIDARSGRKFGVSKL